MGFPRQQYWHGLSFPTPGDLPDPEIEPTSPASLDGFFTTVPPGKAIMSRKKEMPLLKHYNTNDLNSAPVLDIKSNYPAE